MYQRLVIANQLFSKMIGEQNTNKRVKKLYITWYQYNSEMVKKNTKIDQLILFMNRFRSAYVRTHVYLEDSLQIR